MKIPVDFRRDSDSKIRDNYIIRHMIPPFLLQLVE